MNRVLVITYYWPPGSGAGVQRWLKFSKYLPGNGWEPVILTVDPEYAAYPAVDDTLSQEASGNLRVIRTRATDWFSFYRKDKSKIPSAGFASNSSNTFFSKLIRFIRGNFFIPDPRRGWNRHALKAARVLIENEKIDKVITTSPPHSTQLIGARLKKEYPHITWIADLRDPWTDIYYYSSFYHTSPARRLDRAYEKRVLKNADGIITVGPALKDIFAARWKAVNEKTEIIPNGFDEYDFKNEAGPESGLPVISYIGTLSDSYPLEGFLRAARKLEDGGLEFRLRFVGSVAGSRKNTIMAAGLKNKPEFISHVSHDEAVKYMRSSSVLLLIIPDHHSNRCIITGKLFEYLAACRPVLCLGPADGDAAAILNGTRHGICTGYNDTDHMTAAITEFLKPGSYSDLTPPAEYSRKELTTKLAGMLNRMA
jgi:glycosyltransferase involved in cell wall biosynthesis